MWPTTIFGWITVLLCCVVVGTAIAKTWIAWHRAPQSYDPFPSFHTEAERFERDLNETVAQLQTAEEEEWCRQMMLHLSQRYNVPLPAHIQRGEQRIRNTKMLERFGFLMQSATPYSDYMQVAEQHKIDCSTGGTNES